MRIKKYLPAIIAILSPLIGYVIYVLLYRVAISTCTTNALGVVCVLVSMIILIAVVAKIIHSELK